MLTLKGIDKHEKKATPSFTPTRTHCSYCGVAHAPPDVRLNPCSGCHCVFYCSKEHQKIDSINILTGKSISGSSGNMIVGTESTPTGTGSGSVEITTGSAAVGSAGSLMVQSGNAQLGKGGDVSSQSIRK